jgi:hypothetical protein
MRRYSNIFERSAPQLRQEMYGVTTEDMGFVGPSAPANTAAGWRAATEAEALAAQIAREDMRARLRLIQGGRKD